MSKRIQNTIWQTARDVAAERKRVAKTYQRDERKRKRARDWQQFKKALRTLFKRA